MDRMPESPLTYCRYRQGRWEIAQGNVVTEAPVSLTVNGELWLSFMCTPTDVEALALGFLFNEGWIQDIDEVALYTTCPSGDNVDVWLDRTVEKPSAWKRTTGCSGGLTAPQDALKLAALASPVVLDAEQILNAMVQLMESQDLYRSARGVHASAVSDGTHLLARSEDVGRHNTLDKLAGLFLQKRIPGERRLLVTTGRISSEMLQKAWRIGTPVVVSHTAPNALSVQTAVEMGITLIGYARRDQFQVYTHPERVRGAPLVSNQVSLPVDQAAPAAD